MSITPFTVTAPIETDVVIVGAGPCGLFQIFELGLLGIKAHVVEALDKPGGQCAELYPDKPIYDIPALPVIGAQELVDNLVKQGEPFDPTFHYGQQVQQVTKIEDGRWHLVTDKGLNLYTHAVIVAGGVGAFEPVKLKVPGVPQRDGSSVFYSVKDIEIHRDKDIVILGGGDSALDWALDLRTVANSVVVVHRSEHFKAAPASVEKMMAHCDALEMQFTTGNVTSLDGGSQAPDKSDLQSIELTSLDGITRRMELDHLLVFFGLSPKLGPMTEWPAARKKNQFIVDTEKFQTDQPGFYAIGDINWYPGKKKLILSGFHEAALAAFAIKEQLNPGKKASLQYTTTSTLMHERLGVDNPFSDDERAA